MVSSWYTWKSLNFPSAACSLPPRLDALCALRRLARREGTEMLEAHSPFPWPGALPNVSLAQGAVDGPWRSCAVVASAGSLLHAELGEEIDSHDAVMRFNAAPTAGFERHVGSKTTIRLINTKIVTQRKYKFSSSPLYRNVSLVLWETPPRPCNITTWYARNNARFFSLYASLRRGRPGQHFALIPPCFLWGLWDLLQSNAGTAKIRRTSPSSGFLGLMFMVTLCDEVTAYDFVPSMNRASLLCHYFQRGSGAACSLGGFHPRGHEKLLALRMSSRTPREAFESGLLKLPGINGLSCGDDGDGGGDGGGEGGRGGDDGRGENGQ
uniref:Beta-galactoside alpha-2,6-sialyltransferase 1 n=1 Tax=Petromyzon marinus TaxID=7757 RepID=A0AAJ7SKP2_PETMA|nr:beta-galactoside alpha-2,6-sialyltransferase 2-like [Petromyzon marinus]